MWNTVIDTYICIANVLEFKNDAFAVENNVLKFEHNPVSRDATNATSNELSTETDRAAYPVERDGCLNIIAPYLYELYFPFFRRNF